MIFTFFDEGATDKTAVGGKAAVLAQLTQQGYPVPDGFVIANRRDRAKDGTS